MAVRKRVDISQLPERLPKSSRGLAHIKLSPGVSRMAGVTSSKIDEKRAAVSFFKGPFQRQFGAGQAETEHGFQLFVVAPG